MAAANQNFLITERRRHYLRYAGALTFFEINGPSVYKVRLAGLRIGLNVVLFVPIWFCNKCVLGMVLLSPAVQHNCLQTCVDPWFALGVDTNEVPCMPQQRLYCRAMLVLLSSAAMVLLLLM
jgi:hypothetical protein